MELGQPVERRRGLAAADTYESRFVPALFGEWAPLVVDAAAVSTSHTVLDVACGTGVVARELAARVGPTSTTPPTSRLPGSGDGRMSAR